MANLAVPSLRSRWSDKGLRNWDAEPSKNLEGEVIPIIRLARGYSFDYYSEETVAP